MLKDARGDMVRPKAFVAAPFRAFVHIYSLIERYNIYIYLKSDRAILFKIYAWNRS